MLRGFSYFINKLPPTLLFNNPGSSLTSPGSMTSPGLLDSTGFLLRTPCSYVASPGSSVESPGSSVKTTTFSSCVWQDCTTGYLGGDLNPP